LISPKLQTKGQWQVHPEQSDGENEHTSGVISAKVQNAGAA